MAHARRRSLILVTILATTAFLLPDSAAQSVDRIVYTTYTFGGSGASEIFTINPDGTGRRRLTDNRTFDLEPVWSPDHSKIAYVHHAQPRNPDIWMMNADGTGKTRLTKGPVDDEFPQWSPDGTQIAWLKTKGDSPTGRIFVMDTDGTNKRLVTGEEPNDAWPQWSSDGTKIAFMSRPLCDFCQSDWEIHVINADGTSEVALTENDVDDVTPRWSPDGSRLAFVRSGTNGTDIFTTSSDGLLEEQVTSTEGSDLIPRWSPDGSEIAFTLLVDEANGETRLSVVDVETKLVRRLTRRRVGGLSPVWSPDGTLIAFLGFHRGDHEVDVIRPDGTGFTRVTRSRGDVGEIDW